MYIFKFLRDSSLPKYDISIMDAYPNNNTHNKQGIAETAKTNAPTCDNMCIQKL